MTTKRTLFALSLLLLFGLALGVVFALRLEPSPESPQARSQDPETPAKPATAQADPEILRPAAPETEAPEQPKAATGPAEPAPVIEVPAPVIEEAKAEDPDPSAPITIDFVNKDIKTVMHSIAVKSGLQIVVDCEITKSVTIMYTKIDPMQAVRSICTANNLDCVEDGNLIIIKDRK